MRIEIEKVRGGYRADAKDFPESPPVGVGETKTFALAHLIYLVSIPSKENWSQYVVRGEIYVNDKRWNWPQ